MIAYESIYSPYSPRPSHRYLGTVSQIILSLAVVSLALPRDALADDTQVLEPVVVTATRVSTPVSEAPAAVSVITDEQMERRDVSRIGDALTDTPGVFMRGSAFGDGTPGSTVGAITLRGIPGNGRTMLAVDGRSMDTGYNAQINYSAIDLDDIERIEVVPGPFSSLYGGSAFAGVINAITKVPDKREVVIKSGVGGGDALVERGSMVYRDRIDRVGLSVGIGGTNSAGYADEFATGTAPTRTTGWSRIPTSTGGTTQLLGDKGPKPWDEEHGHFTLFLDPTDSMQLTTGVSYSQTQVNFGSPNSYLRNAAGASVLDAGSGFVVYDPSKETATRVFAKSETEIAPKTILKTDLAYSAFGFWYDSPKNTANVNNGVGMQYTAPTTRVEGTVQLDRAIGSWNTVTLGTSGKQEDMRKRTLDLSNYADSNSTGSLSYRATGTATTWSGFVQDKADLTERLTAYLGGRYDYWVAQGSAEQWKTAVASSNAEFHSFYPSRDDQSFSPKVSLVYKPIDPVTLRASAGTAFNTPTLYQLYATSLTSAGVTTQSAPNLKPETVKSWEIGSDVKLPTDTTVRLTYYENRLKNLIYTEAISSTLNQRTNAGRAMVRGVEMGVEQPVREGIKLFANAAYNDAWMIDNQAVPADNGKRLTQTPRWTGNFGIDGKVANWSGNITGRYVTKVFGNDANADNFTGSYGMYDPYFLIDARVAYEIIPGVKASLAMNNITGEKYYQYYLMPGRNVFGELTFKF